MGKGKDRGRRRGREKGGQGKGEEGAADGCSGMKKSKSGHPNTYRYIIA